MGREEIVSAILSDAEQEAERIVAQAREKAAAMVQNAEKEAEEALANAQAEVSARGKAIKDGKAATARLDSQKILLAEKRRVIAAVYARAAEKLSSLGEKEAVALFQKLLERYGGEGDEVVISSRFRYRAALEKLPVVAKKKLKVTEDKNLEGGMLLRGKTSDVDLSLSSLLSRDRDEYQSAIAAEIFK